MESISTPTPSTDKNTESAVTQSLVSQLARIDEQVSKAKAKRAALDTKIAEWEQDRTAVQRVLDRNLLLDGGTEADDDDSPVGYGRVREAVTKIVNKMEGEFTTAQVYDLLVVDEPMSPVISRGSVNNCLNRLAEERKLDLISRGIGKKSPVFRRSPTYRMPE